MGEEDRSAEDPCRSAGSPFSLATVYAALGEKDEAFSWLEKAYKEKSNYLIFLKVDPRLDSLRDDQRLEHLRKKIGLE